MLAIISLILMIFMNDSAVFLWGEIRCWSLLAFKGLKAVNSNFLAKIDQQFPSLHLKNMFHENISKICN